MYNDPHGEPRGSGGGFDEARLKALTAQVLLAQRMEHMGHLTAEVAHDLNSLLTGIGGFAELAMRALPPGHMVRADLQEILRSSERATVLNQQLLAFARKQQVGPRVLVLNDLIAALDEQLRRIMGEGVELIWRPTRDLKAVKVDPGQLEQVIVNLAVNARDAMPAGGTLTLATANVRLGERHALAQDGGQPGDYVLLAISDTGIGIDAELQGCIFEPFFTTRASEGAKGLGLFTAEQIVHHYGGLIRVASEPGRGTTFTIYLPRVTGAETTVRPWPPTMEGIRATQ